MTRLIYAEMLKEAWRKKHKIKEGDCGAVFTGYLEIPRLIDEQPTVDAVEVVRCKDCKYRYVDGENVRFNVCELNHNKVQPDDWYCGDAERRNDED